MEHPNIHANNNDVAESSAIAFNKMTKERVQRMIVLVKEKNEGLNTAPDIPVVDLYGSSPNELVSKVLKQNGADKVCFFTRRKPRGPNGHRANRQAGAGKWKQNHLPIPIKDGENIIGYRRYYEYKIGETTDEWHLHEYEEENPAQTDAKKLKDKYVLCILYKKSSEASNKNAKRKAAIGNRSQPKEKKAANRNINIVQVVQDKKQNPGSSHFQSQPLNTISDLHPLQNYNPSFASNPGKDTDFYSQTQSQVPQPLNPGIHTDNPRMVPPNISNPELQNSTQMNGSLYCFDPYLDEPDLSDLREILDYFEI